MPLLKRRLDIEDSLDILAKPALRRHRKFVDARNWILDYRAKNPNATAKQVVAAAKADGTLVASIVKLIEALAPLIIKIIDAVS